MKVLFITTDSYPNLGTTSNLMKKLFFDGGLIDQDCTVDVLTRKATYDEPDEELIDGVHVFRATVWNALPKKELLVACKRNPLDAAFGFLAKGAEMLQKGHHLEEKTIGPLFRALKRIHAEQYDILVPVFGMFSSVKAVLRFVETTRQKVVVYQVDPYSLNAVMDPAKKPKREAFERKLYTVADAVVTTQIICEEQRALLPSQLHRKFTAMEFPLISEPDRSCGEPFTESAAVSCLFSGNLYSDIRDPSYTLRLFEPLVQGGAAQLHFVGPRVTDLPQPVQAFPVVCHGRKTLSRAQEMMNQADVLVNIGNSVVNQVPSKIFDYLALGKPIINICKNRNCPTLPYFEKYPLALNLFEEEAILEQQQAQLAAFLQTHAKKQLPFAQVAELFATCTPAYCATQMADVFRAAYENP